MFKALVAKDSLMKELHVPYFHKEVRATPVRLERCSVLLGMKVIYVPFRI